MNKTEKCKACGKYIYNYDGFCDDKCCDNYYIKLDEKKEGVKNE